MRPGSISRANGQIGTAGGFAVFPDQESGHRALLDLLKTKYWNQSLNQLIRAYAPPKENKTAKYLRFLKKQTGVSDNRKISKFTPEQFEKLWRAIETMEGKPQAGTITELPEKKPINGVKKDKKGTIIAYSVEGLGWVPKAKAIALAQKGEIDAVIARSRSGSIYLRATPDSRWDNNLNNLG